MTMRFSTEDVALVRAAASVAAHAPERMQAAHLAARLEELARRMAVRPEARDAAPGEEVELLRAA